MSYRVFKIMMEEDEDLRQLHQEQPYDAGTSSLVKDDLYENIKEYTRRTDIFVMGSGLNLVLAPKKLASIKQ